MTALACRSRVYRAERRRYKQIHIKPQYTAFLCQGYILLSAVRSGRKKCLVNSAGLRHELSKGCSPGALTSCGAWMILLGVGLHSPVAYKLQYLYASSLQATIPVSQKPACYNTRITGTYILQYPYHRNLQATIPVSQEPTG